MLIKVLGKRMDGKGKKIISLERENRAFTLDGKNPFFTDDDETREIIKAVLQDCTPLIWAKEDEVHYFGSRNFWIQTRVCG